MKYYHGDFKSRHLLQPGDVVVANTEQGFDHLLIGYSAIVPDWVGSEALFSHHIYKLSAKPQSPLSGVWLHFALSASWIGESIRRFSNGTTVNMLPADAFDLPKIPIPPSGLVFEFTGLIAPMLRQQSELHKQTLTLAQTRDLLLPKLLSGEIRLRDAEKALNIQC